jgi:hypothetical protein
MSASNATRATARALTLIERFGYRERPPTGSVRVCVRSVAREL